MDTLDALIEAAYELEAQLRRYTYTRGGVMSYKTAIAAAKRMEEAEHLPYYVVYNRAAMSYEITTRLPLLGEWYTSDGIRHG